MNDSKALDAAAASRRWFLAVPLLLFAALGGLFYARLGAGDVARIPSALLGRSAPAFSLQTLDGTGKFTNAELIGQGVTLVNVFASWCTPCHAEHESLMQLANDPQLKAAGLRLVGIAYKDAVENTKRFLGAKGNPFAIVGIDDSGRTAIDWGVYGVPETFVLRADGTIAFKFTGPITQNDIVKTILPEIGKATLVSR